MFARIALAAVAVVGLASVASAKQVKFVGNGAHNPNQGIVIVDRPAAVDRPYTLTGSEEARKHNASYGSSLRVGNRVVVPAAHW